MGICVPKQCDKADIETYIQPLLLRYAEEANWTGVSIDIQPSMQYVTDTSRAMTTGTILTFSILGALLILVSCGSIIELSRIGDDPDFDKEVLSELSKFKSSTQYETVTLQRKQTWARWLISLSIIRNVNKLNMQPYSLRKASESNNIDRDYLKYMNVFNGIKAVAILYVMFSISFMFIWYSYISDTKQLDDYRQQFTFLFVYGAYFTSPILFMTAGFLQTFSLL